MSRGAMPPPSIPPYAAFQHRDFRFYQSARFLATIGMQMVSVAVGWQVYAITGRALDLGYVGLAQFAPAFVLSLVTGSAADRFDRRRLIITCYLAIACCYALLFAHTHAPVGGVQGIYAVLVLLGIAEAFTGPAASAFMPSLVPVEHFTNAVAWSSTTWQTATIVGPAAGGVVYAVAMSLRGSRVDDGSAADAVYAASAACLLAATFLLGFVKARSVRRQTEGTALQRLGAGVRYVFGKKIVLGAISLDLFAVLLGGAVALLPIYARDVLHTGPWGLGLLRSAPAIGAAAMAFWIAHHPLRRRSGATMLACVAVFGVTTIVFGLSTSFFLSLAALIVGGAADMVSVVVRQTLVQLSTPDAMRGRVSAVNLVFIGASNELGEFESGVTAQLFGSAVTAVIVGGVGTLVVVALWTLLFPALRDVDRLEDVATREENPA
ncbi:MAG TPA: MFS transporter [bacterium]|nr:MFS transporter [bacterium]